MKSFLFLTGVLTLLVFIGIGCAAHQGPESEGYQKEPLPTDMADMEKPEYDENREPEVVDMSKPDGDSTKSYAPGEVIVKFKPEMDEAQIGEVLTQYKLAKIEALPLPGVYLVKIIGDDSVEEIVHRLSKETAVVYVEPNFVMQMQ